MTIKLSKGKIDVPADAVRAQGFMSLKGEGDIELLHQFVNYTSYNLKPQHSDQFANTVVRALNIRQNETETYVKAVRCHRSPEVMGVYTGSNPVQDCSDVIMATLYGR